MKRLIVDLSSVIWTCLLASKDKEFGREVEHNEKKVWINSAAYGYENAMNHIVQGMETVGVTPRNVIIVKEGMNSKADRQAIHPAYKAGRDKVPEQYEQFNACKEMVIEALLGVGANLCWQDGGVEGDDVIAYLMENLEGDRYALSGDKDIARMVDPARGMHHLRNGVLNANPFGDFPHQFITTYIALVGDSSDKIPGAKGFGEKAWEMLRLAFGNDGLELMEQLIINKDLIKLEEDVGVLRELQRVIDDQDGVYMSYELARLRIERVNTIRRPLQWRAGMVKPRTECKDERLRKHSGVNRIVSAENYAEAMDWARKQIAMSPEVSFDIETSTPQESDEWLEMREKEDKVDVFGSELTSAQLTFGPNMQYTFYLPVDNVEEPGCTNLTVAQVRDFLAMVPKHKIMLIQNVAFELPICYMEWGQDWADDPEWHGFLPNVRDTKIMSSYVDENKPKGLKENSKRLLGYEQVSYEKVTCREVVAAEWDGIGKVTKTWLEPILEDTGETEEIVVGYTEPQPTGLFNEDGEDVLEQKPIMGTAPKMKQVGEVEKYIVQRKMNQMTAREVFDYGCDDTICTAAVGNHFRIIMEIEKTWHIFEEVETYPAYLTALAYVQGTKFNLASMAEQEKDDNVAFDKAKAVLDEYLIKIGFEGTRFVPIEQLDPAGIKRAFHEMTGRELKTMVRTPSKLAKLIAQEEPDSILPQLINEGQLSMINTILEEKFTGSPDLDLASPKKMKTLLYDFMKLPVKIINNATDTEKIKKPELFAAISKFKKIRAGKSELTMTPEEMELLKTKAKTDDTAIDFALAFDADVIDDDARAALKAIGVMKKVMTRRSLFYKTYWKVLHWKDNLIHANTNQCEAVTRRYSMTDPNLTQLPKKGEGVRFREHFEPHHSDAVVTSIDFSGQELRLAAEESQDKNMLACYVGDKLKDIHSITAAGAMPLKWGKNYVAELFDQHGEGLAHDDEGQYELFVRVHKTLGKENPLTKKADDLRKDAKNVNFGAQNGAKAVKLAETLIMPVEDAELFLEARSKMFPDVDKAAERIADEAMKLGYATTMLGARRHLRDAMLSDDRGAADRAARQAWNYRIQGSAGEMTKLAMGRLWKRGTYFKYDARFIAPIHDELVSSVARKDAVAFLKEKNAAMTEAYAHMKVPILASISLGPNFGKQIECGDWFIQDRIEKALNDVFPMKEAA